MSKKWKFKNLKIKLRWLVIFSQTIVRVSEVLSRNGYMGYAGYAYPSGVGWREGISSIGCAGSAYSS